MGTVNLAKFSKFFAKQLYEKRAVSIMEVSAEAKALRMKYPAGPFGPSKEDGALYMLRWALEDVLRFYVEIGSSDYVRDRRNTGKHPAGPVVVPVALTKKQAKLLRDWKNCDNGDWDCGNDGDGGPYGEFDSIKWKFNRGFRKLYPKIPSLGYLSR